MERVSPHVYVDPSDGGCTVGAVVTAEGVILVDSPHQPSRAERLLREIEKKGAVRYVIPTECHFDHTFGLAFMPGTIIAHRSVKARFWDDAATAPNPIKDPEAWLKKIEPEGASLASGYRAREPEILFDERITVSLGGVTLEAFAMPGHLPAVTAVYLAADRVLFTGDNVFHKTMIWYQDALPFEWFETLSRLQDMDVAVAVPGHGPPAGPEVLEEMRGALEEEMGLVRGAVEAGMSREEAVARIRFKNESRPLPDIDRYREDRLQRSFVGRLYDQIKERRSEDISRK